MNAGYVWRDPARHHPQSGPQDPAEAALEAVTRAVRHPDTFTSRRMYETNARWQARAVLQAVTPFVLARLLHRLRDRAEAGDELARVAAGILEGDQP